MGGGASKKAADEAQSILTQLRSENRQLKTELDEEKTKSTSELQLAREESSKLQETLSKAQGDLEGAEARLDNLGKEKGGLESESAELRDRLAALLERFAEENDEDEDDSDRAAEMAEHEARLKELEAEVEALRAKEAELSAEKERLEKELQEVQQKVSEHENSEELREIKELESRIADLQHKGRIDSAASATTAANSPLEQELQSAQIQVQELEREQSEDRQAEVTLQHPPTVKPDALQDALEKARAWVRTLEDDVAAVDKAQARLDELKKSTEKEDEDEDMKAAKVTLAEVPKKLAELADEEKDLQHQRQGRLQTIEGLRARMQELLAPAVVHVKDPSSRGATLGLMLQFFEESCGSVDHSDSQPVCFAHKLAGICDLWNRDHRMAIGRQRLAAASPNSYAVHKFCLKPLTKKERVSAAELWMPQGCRATCFASHAWSEDFGDFFQGLYRYAWWRTVAASPGFAPSEVDARSRNLTFYTHLFSESPWKVGEPPGTSMQDLASYKLMRAVSTESVVVSLGQNAVALQRAWCNLELYMAESLGCVTSLLTREGPLGPSVVESRESSLTLLHTLRMAKDVNIETALSRNEKDLAFLTEILAAVEGEDAGATVVNSLVKRLVAGHLLPHFARLGKVDALKEALKCGARPDCQDHRCLRPLTYAVAEHTEGSDVAALLINAGAERKAAQFATTVLDMFHSIASTRIKAMLQIKELEDSDLRGFYAEALAVAEKEHAEKVIQGFLADLASDTPSVRKEALQSLGSLGALSKPHAAALGGCLSDDDQAVREAAAEAITKLGQASDLLQDSDPQVQCAAMKMLAALGKQAAHHAGAFARLLDDADWIVRHSALHALAHLGDAAAPYAAQIAKCLEDDQWYVRHGALLVLIKVSDAAKPHVPAIAGCLGDTHREVRVAAAEALQKIGGPAAKLCLNIVQSDAAGAEHALPPAKVSVHGSDRVM